MSQPTRHNPEGFSSRPSEMAWGCVQTNGWVPFPKDIPRRHPLLDNVGRTDDPCDRPKFSAPDFKPEPSFKPPREGYPNNMCDRGDYGGTGNQDQEQGNDSDFREGTMVVNVGQGTPTAIRLRLPPVYTTGDDESVNINDCCQDSRNLDSVREKYEELIGPLDQESRHEGSQAQIVQNCGFSCHPSLPKYPCRGVIKSEEDWPEVPREQRYDPTSLRSNRRPKNWKEQKPISGWESIDNGSKTCNYYPIDSNLPSRFNNPAWFKGYGCERPIHPFYVTTGADYGRFGPTPHTMTQKYYPRASEFTEVLGITGMYRNRTLNTSNNKTIV